MRNGTVSDSDSVSSLLAHCYNTRASGKSNNETPQNYIFQSQAKRYNPRNSGTANHCAPDPCPIVKEDFTFKENPSMDYCYDPCSIPEPKCTWMDCLAKICKFLGFIALGLASVLIVFLFITVQKLEDDLQNIKRNAGVDTVSPNKIDRKRAEALRLFMHDPVGRPDFALKSIGGQVLRTNAEVYTKPESTLFGITLCEGQHGPSAMIQVSHAPGECWAFAGQKATAVLQLIDYVMIDAISVEHSPKHLSPSGHIDTAPKDFKIWGLDNGDGGHKTLLGMFNYNQDAGAVQTFSVQNSQFFKFVELEVLTNHGNPEYSCFYRLRVHGSLRNSK